ncbi:MAG TPA: GntR family transcriptional regulator [Verrucomicrobiales bacterium]|nr:GntR family transcriptional regulator [Verrucomicrobiales bacterium]
MTVNVSGAETQPAMLIELNYKSGKPVYLQLVDQVKAAVASGALAAGDPLPSIRPLAERLRVNRNTVAKAYEELESQGIIESLPGKGSFVRQPKSPLRKEIRHELLAREIDQSVVAAHHLQVSREDFLELVRERYEQFEQRRDSAQSIQKETR